MHNLFIIGNGFDLAHGLKTSYYHFMDGLRKRIFNEPEFFQDICNPQIKKTVINDEFGILEAPKSTFKQKFFDILDKNKNHQNWSDIEFLYFNLITRFKEESFLINELGWKGNFNSAKEINEDFDTVKEYLIEHLLHEQNQFKKIAGYYEMFKTFNNSNTTILNFNYTNTVKKYLYEFEEIKLIHIHGELENEDNPIIFGFAASNEESKRLQDQNNYELVRNIKKTKYNLTDNEYNLKGLLKHGEKIAAHILGHSCGVSDRLILNQIFNHPNIDSIRIYYYNGQDGYHQNAINIDRIIDDYSKNNNEELNYPKLITYPQSLPMIQHNSTGEENDEFDAAIRDMKAEQFRVSMNAGAVVLGGTRRNNRY